MGSLPPAASKQAVTAKPARKETLGLGLLVALVVGSIVGSGIFGLPQNMASGTEDGAILLGWVITGFGTCTVARVYQMLSMQKQELNHSV